MQISTQAAFQWFQMADQQGTVDGNITTQEAAKAVLATIQQYNVATSVNDTFAMEQLGQQLRFAGTLLMGGANSEGLIPDFDANGAVSLNEVVRLDANNDGNIVAQDFSTVFGASALNPAGNQFTLAQLTALATPLAAGTTTGFDPLLPTTATPPTTPPTLPPQQAMMMMMMLSMLSMIGSGGTTGGANNNGIPPELLLPILSFILTNSLGLTPTNTAGTTLDANTALTMSQLQAEGGTSDTTNDLLTSQVTSEASNGYFG
jgi:hypothetical protein